MFSIKTAAWFVPTMLIPIVCGQPCEFRNSRTTPFFIETGFIGETAVDVPDAAVMIQSAFAECDEAQEMWSVVVDVSGDVGIATVYPRSQDESSAVLDEAHGMVWSFHPTEGDWSRFTADLAVTQDDSWEAGMSTQMRCDASAVNTQVWVFEIFAPDGQLGDCVLIGSDAAFYSAEFPNCSIWG